MSNRKWRARPSMVYKEDVIDALKSAGRQDAVDHLAECCRVAKAFPPHRRRLDKNLPWELYLALVDCPEDVQERAMDEYEATGKLPEALRFKQ